MQSLMQSPSYDLFCILDANLPSSYSNNKTGTKDFSEFQSVDNGATLYSQSNNSINSGISFNNSK